ncbi:hypothetical protein A2477_00510 [Candidatus Falkowbacteria bacterium RIFOXYC2_FULL_47_12]|uniref:Uncharacterized protein n=2 Tax=Candidatus Falkowiibacteriota TaxID=1752728 RepID=A0A1F5TLL9_9BACT|nr:MAG: hypothetical protein A2242_00225 [Candidatus Falkowbacteria bacterium RIFOXYA2_FULL_47_9]OGF39852.1 MAG: hypothetical protein A2477_00510 [Candidatus Falkowbacteria bacterium RIFOXYC2_FULL_47_12]
MRKKFSQLLIIFFAAIFFLQIAALVFLLLTPSIAGAQVDFTPQVGVGTDFPAGVDKPVDANTIGNYIKAIYQYGIGIVGIVAAVVMMFGGVLWLTAGGDSGKVSEAKEWIKASLFGLILALLSYTILLTVNPDLIAFKPISIDNITEASKTNASTNTSAVVQPDNWNCWRQNAACTSGAFDGNDSYCTGTVSQGRCCCRIVAPAAGEKSDIGDPCQSASDCKSNNCEFYYPAGSAPVGRCAEYNPAG